MPIEQTQQSQKPYRYGMVLLCVGALINWLHLADVEPVRYIGIVCIVAGAVLITVAICLWLQAPREIPPIRDEPVQEKPPDYESVTNEAPPSYDVAIKLDPSRLLPCASPAPMQFLSSPTRTPMASAATTSSARSSAVRSLPVSATLPEIFSNRPISPETHRSISSPGTVIEINNSSRSVFLPVGGFHN